MNPDGNIKSMDDLKTTSRGANRTAIGSFGNGPHVQIEAILQLMGIEEVNYMTWACCDAALRWFQGRRAAIGSFSALIDLLIRQLMRSVLQPPMDGH